MADEDIRQLLAQAAPRRRPPDFERLWRRGRRQRRVGQAAGAVLVAVLAVPAVAAATSGLFDRGPTGLSIADSPSECPVTIPNGDFDAPGEYPAEPASDNQAWYGSDDLWTILDLDGEYRPRKSVWWSSHFEGGRVEPQPDITVTWRRLDWPESAAITNHGSGTNAYTHEHGWWMIAGLDPGIGGCWQVTASYRDAQLSYTYWYEDDFTERLQPIDEPDLLTPQLRNVADLHNGDRLYVLPLTGDQASQQVYVRMRGDTPPLLFGTDCSIVSSVPLPQHWEGTCLAYTNSQGQRVTGTFLHGTANAPTTPSRDHASEERPVPSA